jgi:toxin-antitoxin system PIN domain toxin
VIYLLDVNVLIALMDPIHVAHATAHSWFARSVKEGWATCPTTENGFIRIVSNPKFQNPLGSPGAVAKIVAEFRNMDGHRFWPDDVSLSDSDLVRAEHLLSHSQVTDTYLLALARRQGGQLATFDRRLVTDSVVDGHNSLHLIEAKLQ